MSNADSLSVAALAGLPDRVRVYHGTTAEALAAVRAAGEFRPRDPRLVAGAVEERYGLAAGSVWGHAWNEFSRSRLNDKHVYFDGNPAVATGYARDGSETLADALRTAYRLMWPPGEDTDGHSYLGSARRWARSEATTWGTPEVVALDVPWAAFEASRGLSMDPAEFWALVGAPESVGCVALVGPVPATWIVSAVRRRDAALALRSRGPAADRVCGMVRT